MGLYLNHTKFHGEFPVKVFLKMWGVLSEDISEPLRTFNQKNKPPASGKKPHEHAIEDVPEDREHHEPTPHKGTSPEGLT